MSILENLQSKQISTKAAVIAIATLVVLLCVGYVVVTNATSPPEVATSETVTSEAATGSKATGEAASTSEGPIVSMQAIPSGKSDSKGNKAGAAKAAKSELPAKPADPYAIIAERNIFKPVTEAPAVSPIGPVPPMPVAPLPGAGFGFPGSGRGGPGGGGQGGNSKIAFTGVVQSPDGVYALLENLATGETRYARAGDNAFGMQVTDVNLTMVSLDSGGQPMRLVIGENKTDATATPTPPAGGPPQPPGPGAQPTPSPTPGTPGATPSFGGGYSGRRGGRRGANGWAPPPPGQ